MEAIRQLVIRILAKSNKSGIVTTLPKKDLVDFQSMILAEKFMQNGVDPNALKSADQAFNILKQIDQAETNRIRNLDVSSGKVFDMEGNEIPPGSKIVGGKKIDLPDDVDPRDTILPSSMIDDLPPPGSRGSDEDIAAPFQSQEETLRNMTEAEIKANLEAQNKATIEKIKERKRPDVYTLDDYDTTNMSDIKKEIIRTETKLGNLNPNSPDFKERAKPLIDKITALQKKLREDKAAGGRIGYKDGPKFDKEAEEIAKEIKKQKELQIFDAIASGTKSGKQQIQGAPEGFTIDEETFNAILKADIPISEKIDFLASYQYGKDRSKIEKDNQELFLGEGGFKDRNVGFGFNKDGEGIGGTLMYNLETGEPQFNIGFKKRLEDGGRVGLKSGSLKKFLDRRNFMKTIVGNSPKSENARILQKILDEQKEFKKFLDKNPPVKFPKAGDKEYDDYILRLNQIMAKDRLKSATGGRIGYKVGGFDKARRAFLKMLGLGAGATAAAKSGILRFSDTAVPKVIEKVPINSSTLSEPPPYFFQLAEKIKKLGKPDKVTYQERVEVTRYTGKNGDEYELIEDLSTGDMQITKDKTGVGSYGDKSFDTIEDRTVLEYKKGRGDETTQGTPADEYEEYKIEFDPDGTPADATDMDAVVQKEIIEEATGDAPSIKKASGGIARMLGE